MSASPGGLEGLKQENSIAKGSAPVIARWSGTRRPLGGVKVRNSAVAIAVLSALSLSAQAQDSDSELLGEVVVTGSRIVRDGFTAPTPLTVVGAEQVQQQAAPNLIDYLTTLPAFAGNYTPQSSTQNVSTGTAGTSSVNLRNLGTNRTLVLIDGQRSVPSTVQGLVDINTIPQQLIERVEVVTGGASAAYGSDAVGGVVNFILDKKFTGFKAEVSGGMTDYGDNQNGKISITGGTPFASGRGHLILSGQFTSQDGVLEGDRPWNLTGWQVVNNPNYTATNGQPQRLLLNQISAGNATPGGIILFGRRGTSTANVSAGALQGTAFGENGSLYKFNYGGLTGTNFAFTQGGDWESASLHLVGQSIEPKITSKNLFARASFDITDDVSVFVQSNWYENSNQSHAYPNEFFGGLVVDVNNAFLPAAIRTQALAAGYSKLVMGTSNLDMGTVTIDTDRKLVRNVLGAEGRFNAFETNWTWNAYFQGGVSESVESAYNSLNLVKHAQAIDAVTDASGAIVCRSTLTNPGDGCVAYNPFGTGVNSDAAFNYVLGQPRRDQTFRQNVTAASVNGNPWDSWAGPISLATGVEYRSESVRGDATAEDLAGQFFAGNYKPTFGKFNVKEMFVETLIPLAADKAWAKSLDFNAAVRETDYSTSGAVTTWKAGITYKPFNDLMLRVTRSRDIRAPNMSELFNAGSRVNNQYVLNYPGQVPTTYQYEGVTTGNPNLDPEEADTTGVGFVYQPAFLPGFSASVDYWNINLKDAINTITAQQIADLCINQGRQDFCTAINGGGTPGAGVPRDTIAIQPFNLAEQIVRGVDLEMSYRTALSDLVSGVPGNLTWRAIGTHFIKNYTDNTLTIPQDTAGQNSGGGPASWRWNTSFTYALNPFSGTFSARGVSAGVYGNNLIECTSGCPTSTTDFPTINVNHLAGAIYFDMSLSYTLMVGKSEETEVQTFFNVRNLTNKDPVIVAGGPSGLPYDTVTTNPSNYDSLGRVFQLGVRLKL
jgi:outer membrane receptor protein involved in Fe transport